MYYSRMHRQFDKISSHETHAVDSGKKFDAVPEVGFEPTHPKIIELKSTALDHSAIQAHMLRTDL